MRRPTLSNLLKRVTVELVRHGNDDGSAIINNAKDLVEKMYAHNARLYIEYSVYMKNLNLTLKYVTGYRELLWIVIPDTMLKTEESCNALHVLMCEALKHGRRKQ